MATKTFSRVLTLTPAAADSLLEAMERDVTPKTADVSKFQYVTDPKAIKAFFNKKK